MIVSNSAVSLRCILDARHLSPCRKGPNTEHAIMGSAHQMSTAAKQVVNGTMNRQKPLCLSRGFEPAHLSFSLPCRLMRDFRSIVSAAILAVVYA